MGKKYGDIMEKVEVTDEMRTRILENIRKHDFHKSMGMLSAVGNRKWLALAACLILVVFTAVAVPKMIAQNQEPVDMGGTNATTYKTSSELSKAVGYDVRELNYWTFDVRNKTYETYDTEAVQITYDGTGNKSAVYRISKGREDNSGDYSDYKSVIKMREQGNDVTLKGNGKSYVLAIWSDGKYSYSIALTDGVSKTELSKMISSIN